MFWCLHSERFSDRDINRAGEKCLQKTEMTITRTILTVNKNQKCLAIDVLLDSGEGPGEGQEGELDAMMGELTMDELKAAFRLGN